MRTIAARISPPTKRKRADELRAKVEEAKQNVRRGAKLGGRDTKKSL